MLNHSANLAMSTNILKALPGKLNIKRHSPSILQIFLAHRIRISEILPWDRKSFIIYKVMKYIKILIIYNAYFKKKLYFTAVKISKVVFS